MRLILLLLLAAAPCYADIVYSPTPANTASFRPLSGVTLAADAKVHIRLSETTGAPWVMALDGQRNPNPERYAPYVLDPGGQAEDTTLLAFAPGVHTATASNGTITHSAQFTVLAPVVPAPTPPPAVKVSDTAELTWTAPPEAGITGYDIEHAAQADWFTELKTVGNVLTYSWTGLPPGEHWFRVRSRIGETISAWKDGNRSVTLAAPPVDACAANPLTASVRVWPAACTGSRSLGIVTSRPYTRLIFECPSKVTVTAQDGCTATVVR